MNLKVFKCQFSLDMTMFAAKLKRTSEIEMKCICLTSQAARRAV